MKTIKRAISRLIFATFVAGCCAVFSLLIFCHQASELSSFPDGAHVVLAGRVSAPVPHGPHPKKALYTLNDVTGDIYVFTYHGQPSDKTWMVIDGVKSTVNGYAVVQEHRRLSSEYLLWLQRLKNMCSGVREIVSGWGQNYQST